MDSFIPLIFQEGAAYRGRILVELNTSMEVIENHMVEDIPEETVTRIEVTTEGHIHHILSYSV